MFIFSLNAYMVSQLLARCLSRLDLVNFLNIGEEEGRRRQYG